MRVYLLACILVISSFGSYAQVSCASDLIHSKKLQEDSSYRRFFEQNQKVVQKAVQTQKVNRAIGAWFGMAAATYTIPVVVHIIHTGDVIGTKYNPDDVTINQTIEYLNSVYNGTMPGAQGAGDIGIQFELAKRDPNCNPTTGITRQDGSVLANYVSNGVNALTTGGVPDLAIKSFANWDPGLYYNIYVVNKIDGNDGTGTFIAGYAAFPGEFPLYDGTVMLSTQMYAGTKTLAHEMGHALFLHHPFFNPADNSSTTCPDNTDCTTGGDQVCDTDPITVPSGFVCRTGPNSCAGGAPYSINTESNIMNYTTCFTLFTQGQKDRMNAAMTLPMRQSLWRSWAMSTTYPYSLTSVTPASCTPTTGTPGMSGQYTGLIGLTVDSRTFSSGTPPRDGGYVNKTASCLHLIPLAAGASYSVTAELYAANYDQAQAWIDYNDNGVFETSERILSVNNTPPNFNGYTAATATFTVPGSPVINKVLRMRVINELGTAHGAGLAITGPCYNPVYGQAEDYPVFIAGILPIEWKYFRGARKNNDVVLDWSVAADKQTKHFVIERAADGTNYSTVTTIQRNVAGTSYRYTDVEATAPVYFYRIKEVSVDGSSSYSNVVIVRTADQSKTTNLVVANPFNNVIELRFDQPVTSIAELSVTDISGKTILKKTLSAGAQRATIDLSGKQIARGIYILQARFEDRLITKKIVKN